MLEEESRFRPFVLEEEDSCQEKRSPSLLLLLEPIKVTATVPATAQFDLPSRRALRHHAPQPPVPRN